MRDDEVQLTLERTMRGIERALLHWRRGGPRAFVVFELRIALKRVVRLWWHIRRTEALTDDAGGIRAARPPRSQEPG